MANWPTIFRDGFFSSPEKTYLSLIIAALGACLLINAAVPARAASAAGTGPLPSAALTRKSTMAGGPFFVSFDDVLKRRKSRDTILVDVRPAKEFEKVRIPGSLNLPLYLLKRKPYLKPGNIILVNEGFACDRLEKELAELRHNGFSRAAILAGGLHGWSRKGGPLAGDLLAARRTALVPPRDYLTDRHSGRHQVLVAVKKSKLVEDFFPAAGSASPLNGPEKFIRQLQRLTTRAADPAFSILIVTENGLDYERIDQLVGSAGLDNVFYLQGGLKGYQKFMLDQKLLGKPGKVTTGGGGCPTCPKPK